MGVRPTETPRTEKARRGVPRRSPRRKQLRKEHAGRCVAVRSARSAPHFWNWADGTFPQGRVCTSAVNKAGAKRATYNGQLTFPSLSRFARPYSFPSTQESRLLIQASELEDVSRPFLPPSLSNLLEGRPSRHLSSVHTLQGSVGLLTAEQPSLPRTCQ